MFVNQRVHSFPEANRIACNSLFQTVKCSDNKLVASFMSTPAVKNSVSINRWRKCTYSAEISNGLSY